MLSSIIIIKQGGQPVLHMPSMLAMNVQVRNSSMYYYTDNISDGSIID
jgi:hypothetical protein